MKCVIIEAAIRAGAGLLLSEDLQDERTFGTLTVHGRLGCNLKCG